MIANIAHKTKHIFNDKKMTLVIILFSIACRVIHLIYFFNIRGDGMYQHIATLNFVNGHGISTGYVLPNDLSTTVYEPLINWPPGYSLLLSPFYILFNHNYIAAGLTLDILAAIALILFTRKILSLFNVPVYLVNIFTLLTGFFIYYFYFIASSDAIAISFFIIGLYYTLSLLKTKQAWGKNTTALTISFIICAGIKYLFFQAAIIIPLYLIIKGFADKEIQLKKAGIYSFIIITLVLGSLLIYQKNISGTAAYISQPERGFFPEHILSAYPFIPGSFIKPETISLLVHPSSVIGTTIYRGFQWLHLFLALAAIAFITRKVYKNGFKNLTLISDYLYIFFFISFSITILLLTLSLWVAKEVVVPGVFWTYIEEPRYYGLIAVLMHIAIFILYRHFKTNLSKPFQYIFYFFLLLLLPEMFRGMLFTLNRISNFKKEEYSWQVEDRFQKYASAIIKREKNPFEKVVVTGPVSYMTGRVSLYSNISELNDADKINSLSSLNTKEPVLLLIILPDQYLEKFRPFTSLYSKEITDKFNQYNIYTVHITPH